MRSTGDPTLHSELRVLSLACSQWRDSQRNADPKRTVHKQSQPAQTVHIQLLGRGYCTVSEYPVPGGPRISDNNRLYLSHPGKPWDRQEGNVFEMNTTEDRSRHYYFYSQVYTLSGLLFTLLLHPKGPKSRACGSEKPLLLQLVYVFMKKKKKETQRGFPQPERGKKA